MDSHGKTKTSQVSARALDYFDKFCAADSLESVLSLHQKMCGVMEVKPSCFREYFPGLMKTLVSSDAQELLAKYNKRASNKNYENGNSCRASKILIIGAGPCGLRTAIEAQLLGAKVVVIEKRESFSRNNVLHLWPFVIADLKGLGAKRFYGKFCPGSLDHISISSLQFILLKVALLIGVEIHFGVGFVDIVKPCLTDESKQGWRAKVTPVEHPVSNYEFDVLLGADGRRNTLKGFKRKVLRAKLAIAITANFVNNRSAAEAKVQEISGVSFIFKQDFFNELCQATGIDLENIVYYKDETHYFVMTAKKHSLLWKGVLYNDFAETDMLLSPDNVNRDALEDYVVEAVNFATDYKLPKLQFALNYRHEPDVALIDFTAMYAAENACRVVQRKGYKLLLGLVGDSLLEPFWPTGSGCARGFLSSLDICWTIRSWSKGIKTSAEVIAERESIYRLLAQTTPENLAKDFISYTVEPNTRYPHINLDSVKPFQVLTLFDTDEESATVSAESKVKKAIPNEETDKAKNKHTRTPAVNKNRRPLSMVNLPHKEFENQDMPDLDKLLDWFKDQVKSYELKVDGIQDIFVHGNVLCAILNRFRPDLLPEFPLPPEVQQGTDETGQAAFRNQLAFDFIKGEYALPSFVDGLDAIINVSSNLSNLIDYSVKIYELFRTQNVQVGAKLQIKVASHKESFQSNDPISNTNISPEVSQPGSPQGYVSCVWTSNSSFLEGSRNGMDAESQGSNSNRRLKRSSSIQRIVQRLDNSGLQSQPTVSKTPFGNYQDETQHGHVASREVFINPYNTINNEIRRKRKEEAEKSQVETLRLLHVMKTKQKEERDEERAAERERLIRCMRAQQSEPPPETSTCNFKTVNTDEFFNEYNMRLWRQSRPSIGERTQNLETKLFNASLERKSSFNELPARNKLRQSLNLGLQRSATERHIKSDTLPASVQKFRNDNSTVNLMGLKLAEGQGHISVKPIFGQKNNADVSRSGNCRQNATPTDKNISHSAITTHSLSTPHEKKSPRKEIPPTKVEGLKKSSSVSCMSKDDKSQPTTKKKNDFSEYFRAKEAAIMKQQKSKESAKAKVQLESKQEQLQDDIKRKSVVDTKQDKLNVNESIIKKTVKNVEEKSQLKQHFQKCAEPKQNNNLPERAQCQIKLEVTKPSKPATVTRQSTVEEFDTLFGISEDEEELLSELNPDELNQLLDWTEKNFHVRRGVDTE